MFSNVLLQSLLKTADQLKIKGLCEVPENREGPPSVSLSSPPREPGTPRLNFTKLKRHHPRYKKARTTFEPRATDSRHYDRYKEEDVPENYSLDNKEVKRHFNYSETEGNFQQFINPPLKKKNVGFFGFSLLFF